MKKDINNTDILQEMVKYNVLIEKDIEGWYISEVIELPGCHTQAKNIPQLIERTKEAIKAYLGEKEEIEIIHKFVGVRQIEV
ncbi:MAG: type II toxin-antitoxin system HicB family antitoxin [Candidatus Woesearchaeota archaeon]